MSRAAAEKKQREVLEYAQKKQRVAEAKAEKARQRAAAAAAAKDWPAAPSSSLFVWQLWFVTKSPRIKVIVFFPNSRCDVYSIESSKIL